MYCETISPESIEHLPVAVFRGEIIEITTPEEADRAVIQLSQETLLGFDTETRPNFIPNQSSRHKTALLQLATHNKSYLFRLLYCGITPRLTELLSNPNILKVGAAVRDDIRGLQAYRPFAPAGFIDLQTITVSLGINEKSLRKMAAIVLNLRLSKGQQLSNWEHQVLTPAQLHYAALDAWICREIYLKLKSSS